jgi:hypothetical protein
MADIKCIIPPCVGGDVNLITFHVGSGFHTFIHSTMIDLDTYFVADLQSL